MPREKDLKRLVRARMKKTGEAYTAARAHVTRKPKAKTASPVAPNAVPRDHARVAGMKNEVVKEKTGRTWDGWVEVLDGEGAATMKHAEIAAIVAGKYRVDAWWAQMVTVGYERAKGLRERGQRRDGSYEAGKSRTFNAPAAQIFEAFTDAKRRRRWLEDGVIVRTANPPKRMRLGWIDGSIIAVEFTAKGKEKTSVAVAHTKLKDRATVTQMKAYWSEKFDALAKLLDEG
jgi:uncharacterized protein YndB with AHSA1/START domain